MRTTNLTGGRNDHWTRASGVLGRGEIAASSQWEIRDGDRGLLPLRVLARIEFALWRRKGPQFRPRQSRSKGEVACLGRGMRWEHGPVLCRNCQFRPVGQRLSCQGERDRGWPHTAHTALLFKTEMKSKGERDCCGNLSHSGVHFCINHLRLFIGLYWEHT